MDFKINMPAHGRIARLGDLYDARSETFCNINLLKEQALDCAVTTTDKSINETTYTENEDFSEKFNNLDVNSQLSIGVAGVTPVDLSGGFLRNNKTSERVVRISLNHSIQTVVERLNLTNDQIQTCLSLSSLQNGAATHYVVEIKWGGSAVVIFQANKKDINRTQAIQARLQSSVQEFKDSISCAAETGISKRDNKRMEDFSIKIVSNLFAEQGDLPQTSEEARRFVKALPDVIKSVNGGKGNPLDFTLLPLSELRKQFKIPIAREKLLRQIQEDAIARVYQLFDTIAAVKDELNSLLFDINKIGFGSPNDIATQIAQLKADFECAESEFRCNVQETVACGISETKKASILDLLLATFQKSSFAPTIVEEQIKAFSALEANGVDVAYIRRLMKHGVHYIGRDKSVDTFIFANSTAEEMVLLNRKHDTADPNIWTGTRDFFFRLVRDADQAKKNKNVYVFGFVDILTKDASCIVQYKEGHRTSSDLFGERSTKEQQCIVECTDAKDASSKPNKRVQVELRCPRSLGRGECPNDVHSWFCRKCRKMIEYGFDQKFYCECGAADMNSYRFKCSSELHPVDFVAFPVFNLKDLVDQFRAVKEINILVAGETGVGKSTWINAFANYICYSSLQEAEAAPELLSHIPTSFTMTDDNFQEKTVSTGTDSNEIHSTGQSATQAPRSYSFPLKNFTLTFIDTPGIGDTRGLEQDKINFQMTMSHLSYVNEIHGVCVLLKSNNARLTATFSFCVKELLANLHREASRNIVFCFTHSRNTHYRPGETYPALGKLLKENMDIDIALSKHTMYCFDSEPFRHLAAVKTNNGADISIEERKCCEESWNKSAAETRRMLDHIVKLKPHEVGRTVNLNNARRTIHELTKPLADISQNISTNIAVLKDRAQEVINLLESQLDLSGKLYVPMIVIEPKPLDFPTTVCTAASCVRMEHDIGNNIQTIDYVTRCHENCRIQTQSEILNNRALMSCKVMKLHVMKLQINCTNCGCKWDVHMHITYINQQVSKQVPDVNIQSQIAGKEQRIKDVHTNIRTLQNRGKQLEIEQSTIVKVSSKLAHFLKHNAIVHYNDSLDSYLDHLIESEASKASAGGKSTALQGLKDMKKAYMNEKNLLEQAMINTKPGMDNVISIEEINELVKQLYSLPLCGKDLKKSVDLVSDGNQKLFQYHYKVCDPPKNMLLGKIVEFFGPGKESYSEKNEKDVK